MLMLGVNGTLGINVDLFLPSIKKSVNINICSEHNFTLLAINL